MIIAGYIASVLIGISLGLIGAGGSILTVPLLVYLFGMDPAMAITSSLFIVGVTSTIGAFSYFRQGLLNSRVAMIFGIPSVSAVWITRNFIVPSIPPEVGKIGELRLTSNMLLLILFAILMLFAAFSMIRNKNPEKTKNDVPDNRHTTVILFLQGIGIGIITGLVGAGGGFLIIPALVNILKVPMKTAVGSSLLIIAVNSLAGFLFSLDQNPDIPWKLLLPILLISVAGIMTGSYLSRKIDGKKLKPVFGWLVIVMGLYIIIKETILT